MEETLSAHERNFIPRKELAKWALASLTALIIGCVTFYFTTNANFEANKEVDKQQAEDIRALKTEKASAVDIEYIREDMRGMKDDLRDLKAGNQRIYEILLEKEKEMK